MVQNISFTNLIILCVRVWKRENHTLKNSFHFIPRTPRKKEIWKDLENMLLCALPLNPLKNIVGVWCLNLKHVQLNAQI